MNEGPTVQVPVYHAAPTVVALTKMSPNETCTALYEYLASNSQELLMGNILLILPPISLQHLEQQKYVLEAAQRDNPTEWGMYLDGIIYLYLYIYISIYFFPCSSNFILPFFFMTSYFLLCPPSLTINISCCVNLLCVDIL